MFDFSLLSSASKDRLVPWRTRHDLAKCRRHRPWGQKVWLSGQSTKGMPVGERRRDAKKGPEPRRVERAPYRFGKLGERGGI